MREYRLLLTSILVFLGLAFSPLSSTPAQSLKERNETLFDQLQRVHGFSDGQMASIRALFLKSGYIGQGNPAITEHPLTPQG